ncbi:MAG: hypothetical protein JSV30_05905 [Candidatus Omnitrophota bacterium]|nr:MAG: hypothetical protein JSV30_05905 [Candidatus Omnitrophota bacterium]
MIYESRTLGESPFDFDISWPFPEGQRKLLEAAVTKIKIESASQIDKFEESFNEEIAQHGYMWDKKDKSTCSLWRPDFRMSVDFYNAKEKIAVEIEKTEVKRIIHDVLKLVNGSLTFVPKVRYGVIIHPHTYKRTSGKESVFASRVVSEVSFYFRRLIGNTLLNDVLFIVYNF